MRPASAQLENSPQFPWRSQALASCSALETLTVSSVVIKTDFSRDNQSMGNPRLSYNPSRTLWPAHSSLTSTEARPLEGPCHRSPVAFSSMNTNPWDCEDPDCCWVRWCTHLIPAVVRQRQEDLCEPSLVYTASPGQQGLYSEILMVRPGGTWAGSGNIDSQQAPQRILTDGMTQRRMWRKLGVASQDCGPISLQPGEGRRVFSLSRMRIRPKEVQVRDQKVQEASD